MKKYIGIRTDIDNCDGIIDRLVGMGYKIHYKNLINEC